MIYEPINEPDNVKKLPYKTIASRVINSHYY